MITRRTFLALLAMPATAAAATWDALGCVCRKIGAHWTICRKHWRDSGDEDFKRHLKATHGHKAEIDSWPRDVLLKFHDAHHEGGTVSYRGFTITIPKPSKGRKIS